MRLIIILLQLKIVLRGKLRNIGEERTCLIFRKEEAERQINPSNFVIELTLMESTMSI